jgi:hypothetical protein
MAALEEVELVVVVVPQDSSRVKAATMLMSWSFIKQKFSKEIMSAY